MKTDATHIAQLTKQRLGDFFVKEDGHVAHKNALKNMEKVPMLRTPNFRRFIVIEGIVIVILLIGLKSFADEDWKLISKIPTERKDFSIAVVNDEIYLIGGTRFGSRKGPFGMSLVEIYNPQNNSWRKGADMPTARAASATAVIYDRIYVMGGYAGIDNQGENFKVLDIVEVYDPQTDTWERKQDMSLPRALLGAGVVAGKIYAIGGFVHPRGKKPGDPWGINLVEVYDPATDTWAKRANMPTKRAALGVEVVNDRIYAIGGRGWPQVGNRGGPFVTAVEEYDPKTNRWRKEKDMPDIRLSFSTVVVGSEIYLIGGFVWQGRHTKDVITVDVYNPKTDKWSNIPSIPKSLKPFGTEAVNGAIYVFGNTGKFGNFLRVLRYAIPTSMQ